MRVVDGETERLLPFVAQVVRQVDMAQGRIRVEWELDW
jgi:16S rRNA processing protein RimM